MRNEDTFLCLRCERARALRRLDGGAGAGLHQLPRVALIIDLRGAGAARSRAGLAFVLAGERDAVAFFGGGGFRGLGGMGRAANERERESGREGGGSRL